MSNKLSLISAALFCVNAVSAEQTGPPRHVLCVDDSKRHVALVDAEGKVVDRNVVITELEKKIDALLESK